MAEHVNNVIWVKGYGFLQFINEIYNRNVYNSKSINRTENSTDHRMVQFEIIDPNIEINLNVANKFNG